MKKIVVVGANHAGTAAINTILDNYPNDEVTVFDANSNISFLGCGMALWIGDQIHSADGLFYSSREAMEAKGARVYMETMVNRIDYEKKIVYAQDKQGKMIEHEYDKVILATGSLPIMPQIEGSDLANVQYVKLFQNAKEIIDKLHMDETIQRVTIVGAGYIGVELSEAFRRNGKEVCLIDVMDRSLANYYDENFTTIMDDNLRAHGIHLAYGEKVACIKGNGKVEQVVTDKHTYASDMVVFAVGFKPFTSLAQDYLKLFHNGAYIVDHTQKTSDDNVYAIGDCATIYNNAIQTQDYIALASNAVRSGIIAAHNACGTHMEAVGVQGSNGIKIWDINMVSTGLTLKKAIEHGYEALATDMEDYQKPLFITHDNEKVIIRIVYDSKTRRILGAQLCSKYDISMNIHMFSLAIQEKLTIDKLKLLDIFFLPHFNQPYSYITVAALKAK